MHFICNHHVCLWPLSQAVEKGHEAAKEYAAEAEVEGGMQDVENRNNVQSVIGCLLSGTIKNHHQVYLNTIGVYVPALFFQEKTAPYTWMH